MMIAVITFYEEFHYGCVIGSAKSLRFVAVFTCNAGKVSTGPGSWNGTLFLTSAVRFSART